MIISRILTGGARVGIKNRFNSPQFSARTCISKVICRGPFMFNELRWDINNARFVLIGGIVDPTLDLFILLTINKNWGGVLIWVIVKLATIHFFLINNALK